MHVVFVLKFSNLLLDFNIISIPDIIFHPIINDNNIYISENPYSVQLHAIRAINR